MVNPAGTLSAPSTRVISATLAPLPPSSSRMSIEPSVKSRTHFVFAGAAMRPEVLPGQRRAQAQVGVVLDGLEDRALGLAQRAVARRSRRLGERTAERLDHERVRVF